jgi:hypothetical protein
MLYVEDMNFWKNSKWKWKLIMFGLKGQIVQNLSDYMVQNVQCTVTNMLFND